MANLISLSLYYSFQRWKKIYDFQPLWDWRPNKEQFLLSQKKKESEEIE